MTFVRFNAFRRFAACALLLISASSAAAGSQLNFRGIPYFRFYTAKDFDSSASSFLVTPAQDGTIFYSDNNWIFLYDGVNWQKIYENLNTASKITALLWADGRVYAGGFDAIGELVVDESQQVVFRPFPTSTNLKVSESFEKITATDETVYFQGRRSFVRYDKATGEIDKHLFSTWLTASFQFGGAYHVVTDSNEILRYDGEKFVFLSELSEALKTRDITIADTAVAPNGDIIMGSERRGLFRFDGKEIKPAYRNFKHNEEDLLRDIEVTRDNRLIVAAFGRGIVVLDETGHVLEQFDETVDYRFKSVRRITLDQSGTVWAMFNSTVAKVLVDSPLSAIDERIRPSFFYATQHFQGDRLFVRSFYILYRALFDENGRISGFENALPDVDLEVWSVAESEGDLFLSTSRNGIFRLRGDELSKLVDAEKFDRLAQSRRHPDLIVGGNADHIALFQKVDGTLRPIDSIANPGPFINRMEEDSEGVFWLEFGLETTGTVRIKDRRLILEIYREEDGLPDQEWLTIWMHEGKAYYTHNGGVLVLNPDTNTFEPTPILDQISPVEISRIERVFTDEKGNVWISANKKNMIFWKRPDGSYRIDDTSLAEMGEPYFEFITHLDGGEALLMTAFEFFHFKPTENTLASGREPPETRIIGITSASGNRRYFSYLGDRAEPQKQVFPFKSNSLLFNVANSFSYTMQSPEFQYHLEGFESEEDQASSPWSNDSRISFTNLDPGSYVFKARARLGSGELTPWAQYAFVISPPFYQTYFAYVVYLLLFVLLLQLSVEVYSHRLKKQNMRLERMVAERTKEIESKNIELESQAEVLESQNRELAEQSEEIQRNASELSDALSKLRETQDQLLTTARIAGRAEVATNVLHNVGNVLNSVNIGISNLAKLLARSRAKSLKRLSRLLQENQSNLSKFLCEDEKGRQIPAYLDQLANVIGNELETFRSEVSLVEKNVEHIKKIIATQQQHAKTVGVLQTVDVPELLDAALSIALEDAYRSSFRIEKNYDPNISIEIDKHKLLEVLINLFKNAKESIVESQTADGRIEIVCKAADSPRQIRISITDNGTGIDEEYADKLFTHGFTTKEAGHGFGLHSCANTIKSLGGTLKLESPGSGRGATAHIHLPR